MDPCAQHDPIELPDTVQRPVTALSVVTNLGWGTKGFTPHASGLGCDKPAISDGGTARGDRRWTFLNVLFSDKRLIGTFVQSLVKNGRQNGSVFLNTSRFGSRFFQPPRSEACLTTSVLALSSAAGLARDSSQRRQGRFPSPYR